MCMCFSFGPEIPPPLSFSLLLLLLALWWSPHTKQKKFSVVSVSLAVLCTCMLCVWGGVVVLGASDIIKRKPSPPALAQPSGVGTQTPENIYFFKSSLFFFPFFLFYLGPRKAGRRGDADEYSGRVKATILFGNPPMAKRPLSPSPSPDTTKRSSIDLFLVGKRRRERERAYAHTPL